MKLYILTSSLLLITLLSPLHANEWIYLGGKGLPINQISINPNLSSTIYVSTGKTTSETSNAVITDNFLFKSQNSGANWSLIGDTLNGLITSIAIDPQQTKTLYATVFNSSNGNIYKSNDEGKTWSLKPGISYHFPKDLRINHYNTEVLFMTGSGSSFEISRDSGETWESLNKVEGGLSNSWNTVSLSVNPQNPDIIYSGGFGDIFSGGGRGGIYKTINQGQLWNRLTTPNSHEYSFNPQPDFDSISLKLPIAINPHNPDIIYIAEPGISYEAAIGNTTIEKHEHYLSKSIDGGETWETITSIPSLIIEVIRINPHKPDILYLGTRAGLYRSNNAGVSWDLISNIVDGKELHIQALEINPQQPEILYIGTLNQGIYQLKMSIDCQASYNSTTTIITIPCLDVDKQSSLYKVELSKQATDNKFIVNSIELKQ